MEGSARALFPLHAVRTGLSAAAAVMILSAFTAGGIIVPVAFGWLADRADRHSVLTLCAAVSIAAIALLSIVGTASVLVWPVVFAWGGTVVAMYSIGTIVGPALSGGAMNLWNPHGLLAVLGAACMAYFALVLYRGSPATPVRAEFGRSRLT